MNTKPIHVFMIAAISRDGFIGRDEGHVSTDWTSQEDKDWFWERTQQAGAVVMGSTTFFATRKPGWPLPDRMNYVLTRDSQAIWDRYQNDAEREQLRQKKNLAYLSVSPQVVIDTAKAAGFAELAICGGTSIYTAFWPLVQTVYLTREPAVLGAGLPLIKDKDLQALEELLAEEFTLTEAVPMNDRGTIRQTWHRKVQ